MRIQRRGQILEANRQEIPGIAVEDLAGRVGENLPKGCERSTTPWEWWKTYLGVRSINQFLYLQGRSPLFLEPKQLVV